MSDRSEYRFYNNATTIIGVIMVIISIIFTIAMLIKLLMVLF